MIRLTSPLIRSLCLLIAALFSAVNASSKAALIFEREEIQAAVPVTETSVIARFPFRNAGSDPVQITGIHSDCSCTTPTLDKKSYDPGESGEITVTFEIGSRHGPQKKAVI